MRRTPLNNEIREATLKAVLHHRFDDQLARLVKDKAKLADGFYMELLTASQRKQIAAAPEGWFLEREHVYFYVDGHAHYLTFSKPRRVPYRWTIGGSYNENGPSVSSGTSAAGKAVLDYYAAQEKYDNDRAVAAAAVRATLKNFRFIEDLIEGWPEVKKFVPTTAKQTMTAALAIPPQQLNEMLGLG